MSQEIELPWGIEWLEIDDRTKTFLADIQAIQHLVTQTYDAAIPAAEIISAAQRYVTATQIAAAQ